ncbi:GGDEF domain-containing protein [Ruminococcus sp. HUN007]|uniref:GGDEF domain-containing protein n=1 Tax=Ruminococcus sp. HUN007 TaxID=1514668 RepID=UPI0005D2AF22|nr:GGDEF domain-containing protein [Ruminococcus sp. HUN007]
MDYQSWLEGISGLASLYSFDILPDGSYSEIRLMGVNRQNEGMLHFSPDAPEFYPGIPYRKYWMDLNFERYIYRSGSTNKSLYSYVNARGFWLKGFYIPVTNFDKEPDDGTKTVYCLYILEYENDLETESMSQHPADVSAAVTNISIRLHEVQDFWQALTSVTSEIKQFCGADKCSVYPVDISSRKCVCVTDSGVHNEILEEIAGDLGCTPFEAVERWEKILEMSDCLILEDLSVIEERDPDWYRSLCSHDVKNIVLYEIRCKHTLVGFIWAANFDVSKTMKIKSVLELSSFVLAAVIQNHYLISNLEIKSTVDGLTQVYNRNAMNDRVEKIVSGEVKAPEKLGIAFADLNGLKTVNDKEGHEAGDRLLSRAASLLKVAFGDYEVYRAGGDEFVVFCPDITEEKLADLAAQLRTLTDTTADVRFAVGTVFVTGEYDICKAMQTADERMYKDKEEYYRLHPEKDRRNRIK